MQYSHSAGVAFCCGFDGVWRFQVVSTKQPALFLFRKWQIATIVLEYASKGINRDIPPMVYLY